MHLIALAHPRSGTRYTAHCFRQAGWHVLQEELGEDGIASWMWAVESDEVPNGTPRTCPLDAEVILHVMRDPAAAVSSIAFTEESSEAWRSRWVHIPMDAGPIERAVWSYYGWNRLIDAQHPTHRTQLEEIESAVEEITGTAPYDPSVVWFNSRPHQRLPADRIKATTWKHEETAIIWDAVTAMYAEMGS